MIQRLLIANRGEIALRIIRACRQLNITCVTIYALDDKDSLHVRMADETICIGDKGAQSYLDIDAIISASQITHCDSIHPGYGFLSENSAFAYAARKHNIRLIGPSPEVIELMGNKVNAIHAMRKHGIPTVPGSADQPNVSHEQLAEIAKKIGYPVMVKAAAGGGGRGMKVAHQPSQLQQALMTVQHEAQKLYQNDLIYVEKYLTQPRHVEVQVIADQHGNVVCVGDRDCSLQRRHQKIIEEAPAIDIPAETRKNLFNVCRQAMQQINYVGLGTLEFLFENGEFYFIEMNTRVQVEHPVTEMVTGIDLIQEQLRIHAGLPLHFQQDQVLTRGHALECRINAEDAKTMLPSPGMIKELHFPGGNGVRVDSHIYSGYRVSHRYDSMVAKIITHAETRELAIHKMCQALRETHISGIQTNIALHQDILTQTAFQTGDLNIHYLTKMKEPALT